MCTVNKKNVTIAASRFTWHPFSLGKNLFLENVIGVFDVFDGSWR